MLSLYDISVPSTIRALEQLLSNLKKGEEWCKAQNLLETTLTEGKISDMLPLTRQVQFACDSAKGVLFRVGGEEEVKMEDNEKTFVELYERVEKVLGLLRGAKREKFVDANKDITVKLGPKEVQFNSLVYLQNFMLPNFYFHRTTAYLIMRAAGVEVGKSDFLGFETMTTSAATA